MTYPTTTLVDYLRWRSENWPDKLAYRFLLDGELETATLTYQELDQRARSIGALLQSVSTPGDRTLLLLPPGLDFIAAFFGCLYAKTVAIPTYPPHPARIEKTLPIVQRIADDAKPSAALLSTSLLAGIEARDTIKKALGNIKLLATDNEVGEALANNWEPPKVKGDDIAFLQYTSGSTTTPKGVVLSHNNLIHNMELIGKCFGVSNETHGVIWLPPYHDMGLIGGVLQPLFSGISVTLMPHMFFLQRPLRWLQAISHYGGTISGGPNFAYDLCVHKIKPEQRSSLDLSRWEVAFNGAEPVYHKTLEQFSDYFAPCGFRKEAFLPCYGLAESTLLVVGGTKNEPPKTLKLVKSDLEHKRVKIASDTEKDTHTLVSCGKNISEQQIRVVDMDTLKLCSSKEIGEIWVSGPCVARGYWNKPNETEETFEAFLSDGKGGAFLRSGDLGFLCDGELYITGRHKNLIISGGKNHYAQDIERTVGKAHRALQSAGCAVFSISEPGQEILIVIAEINHKLIVEEEEIKRAVRRAIAHNHGLEVGDIKLTLPGSIPRTTSGKKRHFLCKRNYLTGTLKEITVV